MGEGRGDNKGRPCARGTSPSPHFGSVLIGLVREPLLACCCLTCHVFAVPPSRQPEQHCAEIPLFPTELDPLWITPAVLPSFLPCIGREDGQHSRFGLVWFPSFSSPSQQILPLFFAQKAGIFDGCLQLQGVTDQRLVATHHVIL
ncbi:LOW QUALITY PROTEIN: hypothetical protein GQ55_1G440000 [Panicum hallii var. hallii]|uniref:Uncharacterized protein n=1 Tax=Panicum hallii var. hallii TaxID=1504633 RepID=A0A2T7FDY1_9POAL|nr:LOW QUALITY PROTEIN: hypothetical protein GQ55_1G440000 [Panicum hallii var. hallii]